MRISEYDKIQCGRKVYFEMWVEGIVLWVEVDPAFAI